MKKSRTVVLEICGWIGLVALFVHDWFTFIQPDSTIGVKSTGSLAGLIGFIIGMMVGDIRFLVLLICLLVLAARRFKKDFSKEPTLREIEKPKPNDSGNPI